VETTHPPEWNISNVCFAGIACNKQLDNWTLD
jgi:hypothetical protein